MPKITYKYWQRWLDMPTKNLDWHIEDQTGEIVELAEARGIMDRWSEYSDVVYATVRARKDGYDLHFPYSKLHFAYGSVYMFPKYTLRFLFYRSAGKKAGVGATVHEVRNPKKVHKLHHIAGKYNLDPEKFAKICQRQLRYWPLLK